jgi:tetratricopeptide (TPR) repeat protein
MTSVCLCMIVRDEESTIERCLESCRDLIDYWVICDTGSVDTTPAVIERALAGIPGELHHDEWHNFAHNRTRLMEFARGKADYLLLLDADWTVEAAPGVFEDLTADSYMVVHAGHTEFLNKRVVSGAIDWHFEGATHEFIASPEDRTCGRLDGLVIHVESIGGARTGRWHRDKAILSEALQRDENDCRSAFYLAQTYRDLGETRQAIEMYERRATMGGWGEEVYCSLHQAGVLRAELGDWPQAMALLIAAFESRPARLESLYELSSRLRMRGEHETAHLFAMRGLNRSPPPDLLFVQPWVYRWGMLFEFSITAYWTGHTVEALRACNRLLSIPDLPDEYRDQTKANRRFCRERLAQRQQERGAVARSSITGPRRSSADAQLER